MHDNIDDQTAPPSVAGSSDPTLLETDATLHDADATRRLTPQNPHSTPPSGKQILNQRFVLEQCLGQGSMGSVYKALDLRGQEQGDPEPYVALKILNDELHHDQEACLALHREAKRMQQLTHPNIVRVYDFDRSEDMAFISMEYLVGLPLSEHLAAKPISKAEAKKMLEQLAKAIDYAHEQGFIHADIKPANIFVTQTGDIKVLDFGIAHALQGPTNSRAAPEQGRAITHQHVQFTRGALTPNYASPQLFNGTTPCIADDIYALGLVAYELLSGRYPFLDARGRKQPANTTEARDRVAPPLKGINRTLMRLVRASLHFDPAKRPKRANAYVKALQPVNKRRIASALAFTALILLCLQLFIKTEPIVTLKSLPQSMSSLVSLIEDGDDLMAAGHIADAYNLYVTAQENGVDMLNQYPETFLGAPPEERDILTLNRLLAARYEPIIDRLVDKIDDARQTRTSLYDIRRILEVLDDNPLTSAYQSRLDTAFAKIDAQIQLQ